MIIEAVKIVTSVFPFIKEAFLWREGPQANTPPTPAQLLRRKVAVFALIGSIFVNYLAITHMFAQHSVEEKLQHDLKDSKADLKETKDRLETAQAAQVNLVSPNNCISQNQVFDLVNIQVEKEIDREVSLGVLKRNYLLPPVRGKR
jgi:hypothetical protein